jgi:hypothetical protein
MTNTSPETVQASDDESAWGVADASSAILSTMIRAAQAALDASAASIWPAAASPVGPPR